ncbi:ATP-dependent DNA helicase PIF1-like [Panicum virgatum]|uniref:ATP-dependent DNA helicase PIF1-like n=1 Tax=Panicum virgatum TaxID=38727 RepID=UPI0019D50677|nr:ATP-dependent DNA helicase PIF1-like [Panicum virgatum]
MAEDYVRVHGNSSSVEQFVLRDIADILSSMGETNRDYYRELIERKIVVFDEDIKLAESLNIEQMEGCDLPFGGKIMVFGGDFRQILPVVARGTIAQICDATLLQSYIWDDIKIIRLKQNMRAQNDVWFSQFLLRIDDGTEKTFPNDYVDLPDDIMLEYNNDQSIDILIDHVFPDLANNCTSASYMRERAILSTRNEYVDSLNAMMIAKFSGEEKVYYSHDSVDDDSTNNYPLDFLNSITPNGLPPHELKIKKNCPVILIRNLDPPHGLCNGTRLIVKAFEDNAIDCEIINGQHAGNRVFIPRIPLSPSEDISLPFKFKRKQFPIRLSFGMTINKAQGQTIPNVGIYLPEPVFSYRQLYVALSRGVSRSTTWMLAKPNKDLDSTGRRTKNIVFRDILRSSK